MRNLRSWLAFEFALFRYDASEWFVLTGDRRLVSLLQVGVLTAAMGVLMLSGLVPLEAETPVLFLLFALIAANFTLIAIVTSLSQLVVSQRLESPGEIREKIAETIAYRSAVGETIGETVLPVKPDAFYLLLFESADRELDALDGLTGETRTKRTREELGELVTWLNGHTDEIEALLNRPASQMKHALFVSLNTNYENHVHRAWYLQREYSEEYTDRITDQLERLAQILEHIVVANRLFESTLIEAEVAELSRYLLYVGLPVQVMAVGITLLYSAPDAVPQVSEATLAVLIPGVIVAGFTPFLILSAYIVRLTVVAHRTADTFPFSSKLEQTIALRDAYHDDPFP